MCTLNFHEVEYFQEVKCTPYLNDLLYHILWNFLEILHMAYLHVPLNSIQELKYTVCFIK